MCISRGWMAPDFMMKCLSKHPLSWCLRYNTHYVFSISLTLLSSWDHESAHCSTNCMFFCCVSVSGNTPEKEIWSPVCLKDSFVTTHQPTFKTLLSKRLYYTRSEQRSRLLPDLKSLSKTVHQCCSEMFRTTLCGPIWPSTDIKK